MDVIVTGSSGLIGTALRDALTAAGHRSIRLVRGGVPGEPSWDPVAGTIDAAALEGADAVVHLAGAGIGDRRWSEARKRVLRDSRIAGTRLLVETLATLARPPRVLVSASAVGYYGNRGDEVLTEDSAPGEDFLATLCRDWELATTPAVAAGVRVVLARAGVVLDRSGGMLPRLLGPFRLGLGGRVGSGTQWVSWITLADHVAAILHALHHDSLSGPVNHTAPNPVTSRDLTATLARVLHRPAVVPTPLPVIRVVFGRELVQHLLLDGQRVLPARLETGRFEFEQPELEGALRALLGRAGR